MKLAMFIKNFSFLLEGNPVAEFSVSFCSTPKFICSSDDSVPRLLITEKDTS